jgi:hypothetical protein
MSPSRIADYWAIRNYDENVLLGKIVDPVIYRPLRDLAPSNLR